MDGRGRLAQSLTWIARLRARPPNTGVRAFVFENLMRATRPLARRMLRWTRGWFLALFWALAAHSGPHVIVIENGRVVR